MSLSANSFIVIANSLLTEIPNTEIKLKEVKKHFFCYYCRTDILPALFIYLFIWRFFTIVWKNIGNSVFVAVQDSCTYTGTKLCLNDHYLCETFCLWWTIHHCNTTHKWGLIYLQVLIEHLPQLAWMPTYGTAIRYFRHQTAVYMELLLWHEFNSNCSLPCRCHFNDNVWMPVMPNLTAGPSWGNNQWTAFHDSL